MSENGYSRSAGEGITRDMNLEPDVCYRAIRSRDPRFDGRFYTGVKSTGIYCRPVCPARTPKRANCTFFRCATEAQEAGFRPCLRCRPESSPGAPAWVGSSAVVSRALRLIQEGALERDGVDALAARLGVGSRHLRRLFAERLGASPIAIEQTRRVQFAKKLLDETPLTITQIALSSGFGSIRRFNAAIRAAYGCAARDLRRERPRRPAPAASLGLELSYRPPLDWDTLIEFLGRRAIPGVERVDGSTYRRTIELDGRQGTIAVRPVADRPALRLEVPNELAGSLPAVVGRIRAMFDLDADPERIRERLGEDPRLRTLVRRRPGLRVPGGWDRFELGVRAILGQQVTVRGAVTLASRLVREFGGTLAGPDGELTSTFPQPRSLVSRSLARAVGMPESRARAIRGFARAVDSGELELDPAGGLDPAVQSIRALPGVGEWTAQYIAMRALREPDAFPASDLGIRRALADGDSLPSIQAVKAAAEPWRPWRAYAAMHLWVADAAPSGRGKGR
jgi:AraC family transcriptional regulator of adaptative response / DNA-3-methyladenine glycosylase II